MKKTKALWASPHTPLTEQLVELSNSNIELHNLGLMNPELAQMVFNTPSDNKGLFALVNVLIAYCCENDIEILIQPGGSPAFQFILGIKIAQFNDTIENWGISVMYAHSERISIDTPQEDGTVVKTSIFKHTKFIKVC